MYISGRERRIIEELLNNENGITIEKLARALDVSSRTIHRDLKVVESILDEHDLLLNKKTGVGVSLEGDKANKERLNLSMTQVEYTDYTPEERHAIILTSLLEALEPIKLFTLANELNVTIATVSNDLDKLEAILEEYKLSLVRKRGYGVKVEGKESSKRAALSHLITKYVDELDFMMLIKQNIEKRSKQPLDSISDRLLGLVDQSKLVTIEKSIEHVRNDLPYALADSSYIGLVVHLALAIERIQKGERIHFDLNYLNELKHSKEYQIAEKIIQELQDAFKLKIPVDEIGYITMHLLGAKLRTDNDYLLEESSIDIAYQTKALITTVEEKIQTSLSNHQGLFNDLLTHLKPTIYRIQKDMHISNPLMAEIRRDYQALFKVIKSACVEVFHGVVFPDEEIAYLVLHFAAATIQRDQQLKLSALVICSSGIGTSKMLASRIQQEISEIDRIDNCSLFELNNVLPEHYDLVISTIPLREQIDDYVLVSPILTNQEIAELKTIINQKALKVNRKKIKPAQEGLLNEQEILNRLKKMQAYGKITFDLLQQFDVHQISGKPTKDEALHVASTQIKALQRLDNSEPIYQVLLERERLGGLGIPNTALTLFHARHEQIRQPLFIIFSLGSAVEVMGMDNKPMESRVLLVMLSPKDVQNEGLEILSHISALIIRNEKTIELFESNDKGKIKQYLAQQLNQFINEKL
ncbi:mannitol operon transcriptional antiterminator [Amphibacillus marinus]|uniref:Mannitol operon transcriptional antiterminator n=1 Tax=Amphibacillus marinus TaxID=872970 RepID=A0A1H8KCU1_9BACI|nr:BglG family transcription antiterminator [Amphibacillus marinus]SEN90839.1 mannitol operon transcriptional antiterminator [Amphibacillus marinus]